MTPDPITTQAAAHVHAIHLHALRSFTSLSHGVPTVALAELDDIAHRVAELRKLAGVVMGEEYDPPCSRCGEVECRCEDCPRCGYFSGCACESEVRP